MAKRATDGDGDGDDTLRPTPTYLKLLDEKRRRAKNPKELDTSSMTLHRQFGGGKSARPTLSAANKIARKLREQGEVVPPPAVAIIDEEDYEWIRYGRAIRESRGAAFGALLGLVKQIAPPHESLLEAKEEFGLAVTNLTDKLRK